MHKTEKQAKEATTGSEAMKQFLASLATGAVGGGSIAALSGLYRMLSDDSSMAYDPRRYKPRPQEFIHDRPVLELPIGEPETPEEIEAKKNKGRSPEELAAMSVLDTHYKMSPSYKAAVWKMKDHLNVKSAGWWETVKNLPLIGDLIGKPGQELPMFLATGAGLGLGGVGSYKMVDSWIRDNKKGRIKKKVDDAKADFLKSLQEYTAYSKSGEWKFPQMLNQIADIALDPDMQKEASNPFRTYGPLTLVGGTGILITIMKIIQARSEMAKEREHASKFQVLKALGKQKQLAQVPEIKMVPQSDAVGYEHPQQLDATEEPKEAGLKFRNDPGWMKKPEKPKKKKPKKYSEEDNDESFDRMLAGDEDTGWTFAAIGHKKKALSKARYGSK